MVHRDDSRSVGECGKNRAGRTPELALNGHVHNYQRFTGSVNAKPLPVIVAGAGGYNLRLHGLSKAFHTAKRPVKMAGGDGVLETFNDSRHGYLRITVTKKSIACEM
jgi:hypothetical protein